MFVTMIIINNIYLYFAVKRTHCIRISCIREQTNKRWMAEELRNKHQAAGRR